MRMTLTLLAASTALAALIAAAAPGAMPSPATGRPLPLATLIGEEVQGLPLILASGDDDDDARRARRGGDDEDDDDEEDDDEEDDDDDDCEDDDCPGRTPDPAPASTLAPPRNGLFGPGTPPQVQVK